MASQESVSGWTFDGWYLDEACAAAVASQVEVAGDVTLYGRWTKNPEPKPEEPTKPSDPAKPADTVAKAKDKVPATGDATSGAFVLLAVAGAAAVAAGLAAKAKSK